MTNTQAASASHKEETDAELSLAIMQADIDKALQAKRQESISHSDIDISEDTQTSNDESGTAKSSESLLKPINEADNGVLDEAQISRVIEMAWEDRTPFAAIEYSYGLNEAGVIALMRQELKPSSFRLWRERVTGRDTKHQAKRSFEVGRAYCKTQYKQR